MMRVLGAAIAGFVLAAQPAFGQSAPVVGPLYQTNLSFYNLPALGTRPAAPASGGVVWCDTSSICYVSTPAYPNGFPIAGQTYNNNAGVFWHIVTGGIGFGFGDPAAPANEYSVLRSQKNVTGSGGSGLENNLVATTLVAGKGYLVQLEQEAAQGASSIVTSIATIANGTTLSAPGLAVGTTVASTVQNSPSAGLMTINLSAPTVAHMYLTAQGAPMQIAYGSSSATEDENTVLSTCKTWQVSGRTCVAGFFAAERFNPLGPTPFPLDIVATDNTGYGSQTSGALGGECDVNASGPDNRTYAAPGIATSAVGVRRCLNVIATSMGPSVEGPSEIADGFNFQLASPVYSNDPVTLDHAVRCMGIVGWGNISSCMTSDGSALGQNVISLTPGHRTQVLHASASSGQNQIVFSSQAPATTGQIVSDSQGCIPAGSYVGTVSEGTTVPNTIANLVQADGVTASNLTCNATALDNVTVTNRYAAVAAGTGVFTDAFLDLANQGAPGVIKFGSTNNTGTVGKLSFMGQDASGTTVDYGDLTGTVVSNTHGATVGALDMPVLATAGTTPILLSQLAQAALSPESFGAAGDCTTDDSAAFNAQAAYIRASAGYQAQRTIYLQPNKCYLVRSSINWGGFSPYKVTVVGNGSTIVGAVGATYAIINAVASQIVIKDLHVISQGLDLYGVQSGNNGGHDYRFRADHLNIIGTFVNAALLLRGAEDSVIVDGWFENQTASGFAYINDGLAHWAFDNTYQADSVTPNTQISNNSTACYSCTFENAAGGTSAGVIWLGNFANHNFYNSYALIRGTGPIAVIYSAFPGATITNSGLLWDMHMESAPTTDFFITGTQAAAQILNLTYSDHVDQVAASGTIFTLDTGIGSLNLAGLKLAIGKELNAGVTMFDQPGKYSGSIDASLPASNLTWNATAGSFTGCVTAAGGARMCSSIALLNPLTLAPYTVSGLPACNVAAKGELVHVTDQSGTPSYGGALTGGGALDWLAYCNGSAWAAH